MESERTGAMARLLGAVALAATMAIAWSGTASAITLTWQLNFTDGANAVSALITTGPQNVGNSLTNGVSQGYNITSITGTFGGNPITALATQGALVSGTIINDANYSFDNILYGTGPAFDAAYGLAYFVGTTEYNLYAGPSGTYKETTKIAGNPKTTTTVTGLSLLQVPEPASLAMLALGVAGLGFARRRKISDAAA